MTVPGFPSIPADQIEAEVANDVRRLTGAEPLAKTAKRMDARARQLTRLRKRDLVAIVTDHARRHGGGRWAVHGPHLWSRDELVSELLRYEFPEVTR